MNKRVIAASTLVLAACGSAGASVPAQFSGTWGADCASPYVTFAAGTAKVFPDNATYKLKSAVLTGSELSVSYDDASRGTVTDVYVADGSTLRLDRTGNGTGEATWHKAPMQKCS